METATVTIEGERREMEGTIVAIDEEASGLLAPTDEEGDFLFSATVLITPSPLDAAFYVPGDSRKDSIPIAPLPHGDLKPVHLDADAIKNLTGEHLDTESAVEMARNALDPRAALDDLWERLQLRTISVAGVVTGKEETLHATGAEVTADGPDLDDGDEEDHRKHSETLEQKVRDLIKHNRRYHHEEGWKTKWWISAARYRCDRLNFGIREEYQSAFGMDDSYRSVSGTARARRVGDEIEWELSDTNEGDGPMAPKGRTI